MATAYIGSTSTFPREESDVVAAASGGTLSGGQTVQIVFDDSVFDSSREGKERLCNAVEIIYKRLQAAKLWPLTSAS